MNANNGFARARLMPRLNAVAYGQGGSRKATDSQEFKARAKLPLGPVARIVRPNSGPGKLRRRRRVSKRFRTGSGEELAAKTGLAVPSSAAPACRPAIGPGHTRLLRESERPLDPGSGVRRCPAESVHSMAWSAAWPGGSPSVAWASPASNSSWLLTPFPDTGSEGPSRAVLARNLCRPRDATDRAASTPEIELPASTRHLGECR